ncbi:unnamed protein product [Peronospora belbahrii]|uniref:Uncharacterized protein n=1 Tax=Peronospora belbahrii TaxID=622444 RepID=A0AAU9L782_9STRA|nr:unnamed protein product [Peronospora belbahrii]CAH0522062.1 unnamed protein product [Peronospora belbahrii]
MFSDSATFIMSSIAVGICHHVLAFEAPLHERKALRALKCAVYSRIDDIEPINTNCTSYGSVAIADAEVFQFLSFLLSPMGYIMYPNETKQLLALLELLGNDQDLQALHDKTVQSLHKDKLVTLTQWEDTFARYSVSKTGDSRRRRRVFVLITYRPKELLPLYMASARRAVKFVNAVVALVTANAYVSTLGGGHFLCRHLSQSTLLAKLQIGISMGLKDPILEGKCRVNLMYNALQLGKFRRAKRILRQEKLVAEQLDSDELRSVCHAASVYFDKMERLHKDQVLFHRKNGRPATLHDNFYRQRIVRMTK